MNDEKVPGENVKGNRGTSVAEMAEVIGSYSANVHGNLARDFGFEDLFLLSHGVVNPENTKLLFSHCYLQMSTLSLTLCSYDPFSPNFFSVLQPQTLLPFTFAFINNK